MTDFSDIDETESDPEVEGLPVEAPPASVDPSSWVSEHGDYLYRFAFARLRDRTAAEEIVQETLLAALEGVARFQGRSSIRTWLTGILKYKVLEHIRRRNRIDSSVEVDTVNQNFDILGTWKKVLSDWGSRPDAEFESKEFADQLTNCLGKLNEKTRLAFVLYSVDDVEAGVVCERLGIQENHLWVLLYRARMGLRQCLEKNWIEGTRGKQ